jgi:hypothetical protein
MTTFASPDALLDAAGTDLGTSGWIIVDQARIDRFADATGDHQWIHVDPERAAAGPFGGTIAHGYLSLSLLAPLDGELLPRPGRRRRADPCAVLERLVDCEADRGVMEVRGRAAPHRGSAVLPRHAVRERCHRGVAPRICGSAEGLRIRELTGSVRRTRSCR